MARRSLTLMLVLAATWGGSYLLIKISLRDLEAPVVVCGRLLLGALALAPFALRGGGLRALSGRWGWVGLLAVTNMAGPMLLITFGETRIASGLTGVLVAASPVFTALIGLRLDASARLGRFGLSGIALGMVGVIVLFAADLSAEGDLVVGGLMVLLAAVGYAIGAHTMRAKLVGAPAATTAAVTMAVSMAMTLPWALATLPASAPGAGPLLALVALGALGTGVAFVIFYGLIAEIGASRAAAVTYLAPGFAVVYGAVFLGEAITVGAVAGLVLILGGCWMAARDRGPRAPAAPPPEPAPAPPPVSRSGPSRSSAPVPARAR